MRDINLAEWGAHPRASDRSRRLRATVLNTLNRWFMKLVSPRSFHDIVRRYERDIAAVARTTPELWAHANHPAARPLAPGTTQA